jgi:hypothetical protein
MRQPQLLTKHKLNELLPIYHLDAWELPFLSELDLEHLFKKLDTNLYNLKTVIFGART